MDALNLDWRWALLGGAAVLATTYLIRRSRSEPEPVAKFHIGQITLETLGQYCGYDFTRPILIAVKGQIYDVTSAADQYGPGKPKTQYAGREIARALAKGSQDDKDLGSAVLHDLDQAAAERLKAAEEEIKARFDVVGEVVPLKDVTKAELASHDGKVVPGSALWLAIQGTVFDVSRGAMFYGPDGMYPFAGKECARALALMSTELTDCNDNVTDLGYVEKETLRDWIAKFRYKYPIIGKLVD